MLSRVEELEFLLRDVLSKVSQEADKAIYSKDFELAIEKIYRYCRSIQVPEKVKGAS